ncbi:hypothetical protein KKA17_06465 [bacterium]|nr:hypothetical protein [bacterium]MBU1883603.1 hypothetical protein [bacterium]
MGWTCQHDLKGHCKLLNVACVPGVKGCIINKGANVIFSSGNYEEDKKRQDKPDEEIDFSELAKRN